MERRYKVKQIISNALFMIGLMLLLNHTTMITKVFGLILVIIGIITDPWVIKHWNSFRDKRQ